jgi:hypothetical protein
MRSTLLDLLKQDIYSDKQKYAGQVRHAKEIVHDIESRVAGEMLIKRARELYQTDDIEIDDYGVETSRASLGEGDGENGQPIGTWVQAWVWVADIELE